MVASKYNKQFNQALASLAGTLIQRAFGILRVVQVPFNWKLYAFKEPMKFSRLDGIINTNEDMELSVKDPTWKIITNDIKNDVGWLSENEYHAVFNVAPRQLVYAFETFERVSKATGLSKRLSTRFVLGWESFNEFQQTTDILFLYIVPEQLDWVFYGNRDKWSFSTRHITNL